MTVPPPTSSLSFAIERADASDANAIASLGGRVFSESFGFSLSAADLEAYLASSYSPSAILAELTSPNHTFYVARSTPPPSSEPASAKGKGKVLGFAQLTTGSSEPCLTLPPSEAVELQRIYTDSSSHSRGIGSALFDRAMQSAREMGARAIWLGVWEENVKAQRFYQRLGFNKVGVHDFKMGECVQTDWIMERHFDGDDGRRV